MLAIGLMSGTSLDGVDAALVEINEGRFVLRDFLTVPYHIERRNRIFECLHIETSDVRKICSLNFELGFAFCEAVDQLLERTGLKYMDISFIASHGQTIWHNPEGEGGYVASTLQIGEAAVLSHHTNIDVVSNFRVMDVADGGKGAPLVPYADYVLFSNPKKTIALQNLGGIGNVTCLKKGGSIQDIVAFDTGPGNVLIDLAMQLLFDRLFDENGDIARKGRIIEKMLLELESDPYLYKMPPKTTGREKYTRSFVEEILHKYASFPHSKEDVMATLTHLTARSIKIAYDLFLPSIDEIIVSGGGSHNQTIMDCLRGMYPGKVHTAEEVGFSSDAKEALAFVVLGYETVFGRPSNVPSATGAKNLCILGQITKAPFGKESRVDR